MRLLIAVLILSCSTCMAQTVPADAWINAAKKEAFDRRNELSRIIKVAEAELAALNRGRVTGQTRQKDGEYTFADRKQKASKIETERDQILTLKQRRWNAPQWTAPNIHAGQLRPGQVGRIVSGSEGVVGARVLQVLDKSTFLGTASQVTIRFEGFDTSEMTDGKYIDDLGIVYIKGNTTYDTALGTNTVMVAVGVPEKELKQLQQLAEEASADTSRARSWSDVSGKFKITAELLDFDGKTVTLRKEDGTKPTLPFTKLSKDDKQYVQEQLGAL